MDNRTKTALTSGAFTPQRSQYVGGVKDNTIIVDFSGGVIGVDPDAINSRVILTLGEGDYEFGSGGIIVGKEDILSIYLPRQVKTIGPGCLTEARKLRNINLENIEAVGEGALAVVSTNENTLVVNLKSAKKIEPYAFAEANVIVHLNEDVEEVGDGAFEGIEHLYYHGELEGAPWGAKEWN